MGDNVRKVAGQWLEVAACIPPSFFQVSLSRVTRHMVTCVSRVLLQLCEMLEGMIPDSVSPLCDSVIAHIMIRSRDSSVSSRHVLVEILPYLLLSC